MHRILGWSTVSAMMIATPLQVAAQTNRAVPYGSPLDPYGQSSGTGVGSSLSESAQSQANGASAAQAASRVDQVQIDSQASGGLEDDTLDAQESDGTVETAAERQARLARRNLQSTSTTTGRVTSAERVTRLPAPPSEFETYVERTLGRTVPRFGADLLVPGSRDFSLPATATVPPSYVLGPGDRIFIGLTGSISGSVNAAIDTDGRIFLPEVGAIRVAGTPFGELRALIARAVGRQYRDFTVNVSVQRLRGIRVSVTGFANNPGSYTVSSLSTISNAVLAAGGPSSGGGFRSVKLFRNGAVVRDFDLYDLILRGDRSNDAVLQNEDVLYIEPLGRQIAVTGSVNAEAIYEAKAGETLAQMLGYAGGATALAEQNRVILNRVADLDTRGAREINRAELASVAAEGADILQVLPFAQLARPLERQSVVVRVEGEVARPGNYYVRPGASLDEVLAQAGGLTSRAFVFGTRFERLSVRQQQQESFEEAVRQFELTLAAAPLSVDTTIDVATRDGQIAAARSTLQRLREAEPDGRMVIDIAPDATTLPGSVALQNSDRIFVPTRPSTVGVFGAVYRPSSFLVDGTAPLRVRDYLKRAGGPVRAADRGDLFVVRANGAVLTRRDGALNARSLPGDIIFVPVKTSNQSLLGRLLQITQLVFQLGLTAAAVVAVTQ